MYAREIEGREFSFGVSGKLVRNALVMYDRQTESYWSQILGAAIAGEMAGTQLAFLPSWHTTWSQWQAMHPETLALRKNNAALTDPYDGYYRSGSAGVIGETFTDERLYTKEFVIGVELPDVAIAYPFRVLNTEPVVNDEVNSLSLLVVFDAQNASGRAYRRAVDGHVLTFAATENPSQLVDLETETLWDAFSGVALQGPLAGQVLTPLKSTIVFWFGWKDFFPETLVYGLE